MVPPPVRKLHPKKLGRIRPELNIVPSPLLSAKSTALRLIGASAQNSVPKSAGAPERVGLSAGGVRDTGRSPPFEAAPPGVRAALARGVALLIENKASSSFWIGPTRRSSAEIASALQAKITPG
jgi:hypothetical protein